MGSVLRQFSDRPRVVTWACLGVIVATAIFYLGTMDGVRGSGLPDLLRRLCGPGAEAGFAAAFIMWSAMVLAMMLPAASPMIATYLDIAEAASEKHVTVAAPGILAAGYVTVWIGFAAAAALLESLGGAFPQSALLSGLVFVAAGLYQFTPLKRACLSKCRSPMSFFLSNWSDRPVQVFAMGIGQGVACLGCCWALMALGFAAGLMNLAWMAFIAAITILERMLSEPKVLTHGLGYGLIAAGLVMMIAG
jgi:predicted metal-binding membrane protein